MTRFGIDPPTFLQLARSGRPIHTSHQLVAPNSLRSKAFELLLPEVNHGHIAEREAFEIHERLTELKVRLLGDRMSRRTAWNFAREFGWPTLADAEYLAVTRLQADAIVTIDPDLAAKASGVVPLAPFDSLFTS
jgi:predicted nucleic acid-binding protein